MIREPVAIGFYPHDEKDLHSAVSSLSVSSKKIENALGAIVPHAGYAYSGAVAGAVYDAIGSAKKSFVMFGPNHTGNGQRIAMSASDWRTPLGAAKADSALIEKLKNKIPVDESAHTYEHSIEVQLPFLQTLFKDFSFVALCLQHLEYEEIEELAAVIAGAAGKSFFMASSDFMHFGPMYGYEPVNGPIKRKLEWVKQKDNELIRLICALKAEEFYSSVVENGYTVCGFVPITLLLLLMKGARAGELVKYSTSHDVSPGSSFVSYAGIVFR